MPRNKLAFKQDIKNACEDASVKAMQASFDIGLDENESVQAMQQKIAKQFGSKFGEVLAESLPEILDNYLDSLQFDTSKLTAAGSPVAGVLTIIST